jgi:ethanolamine utilization protein EutN
MFLGRVVGRLWATAKNPQLEGVSLLIVQPVTPELKDSGRSIVCADSIGAGPGEIVYWVRSKEASFPFAPKEPPVDAAIVGIVDSVHVERPAC